MSVSGVQYTSEMCFSYCGASYGSCTLRLGFFRGAISHPVRVAHRRTGGTAIDVIADEVQREFAYGCRESVPSSAWSL